MTPGSPGGSVERPALFFRDAAEFNAWLAEHHDTAAELWMGLRAKHVPERGLTWAEAVPEALCYGWIDSVSQPIDADSRRQRWTPRRPGGNWSKVNIAHVERLTAEGRMHPAGVAAFARRQPERSGVYSYETADTELSAEFAAQLSGNAAAAAFFAAQRPSYRRIAIAWVQGAKRYDTRQRRMDQLIADSAAGLLIKSQRR